MEPLNCGFFFAKKMVAVIGGKLFRDMVKNKGMTTPYKTMYSNKTGCLSANAYATTTCAFCSPFAAVERPSLQGTFGAGCGQRPEMQFGCKAQTLP